MIPIDQTTLEYEPSAAEDEAQWEENNARLHGLLDNAREFEIEVLQRGMSLTYLTTLEIAKLEEMKRGGKHTQSMIIQIWIDKLNQAVINVRVKAVFFFVSGHPLLSYRGIITGVTFPR